jgi:hypothetical protein
MSAHDHVRGRAGTSDGRISVTTPTDPNDPYRPAAGEGSSTGAGTGYDAPPPGAPPYGAGGGYDPAPVAPGGYPRAGSATAYEGRPPQNGLGTAALVVGIFAVILGIAFFPLGFVLGAVGIGLGIAGRKRARRGEATNGGAALTGLVLSIVGVLIAIAFAFLVGYIFTQAEDCTDPDLSQTEQQQCLEDKFGS